MTRTTRINKYFNSREIIENKYFSKTKAKYLGHHIQTEINSSSSYADLSSDPQADQYTPSSKGLFMKYVRGYLAILGITMLAAFGVYFWMPSYRSYLLKEDSLIENLSAGLYLVSFGMGLLFFLKSKMDRKALAAVSAVSLLGFLDEISFGERLFDLDMPRIYGMEIDAAHDLVCLAYRMIMRLAAAYPAYLILFLSAGIIIVTVPLLKYRSELSKIIAGIHREEPFLLALFFTILIFFSIVIDLEIVHNKVLFMIEELFEMNAALALLMCCFSLHAQRSSNESIS